LRLSNAKKYTVFFIGHELGDLVWYLFVAIVVMAGRAWLLGGAYAIVLRISAVIILIFGAGFIIISLRKLLFSAKNNNLQALE